MRRLTPRQLEVEHLLCTTDLTHCQIAEKLGLTPGSVQRYVLMVIQGRGVSGPNARQALTLKYFRRDLDRWRRLELALVSVGLGLWELG